MKEHFLVIKDKIKQPWILTVILVAVIPICPEYVAPVLASCSLIAAHFDACARGTGFQIGNLGKLILIYIAYMALGVLYSTNILSTLATLGMWIVMFMAYMALTTVLQCRKRLDTTFLIVTLVAGTVGLIGCVQYMPRVSLGLKISTEFWSFIDEPVFDLLNIKIKGFENGYRVSSTFNNPNIFAEFMVMALPFAAYYSIYGKRKKAHLLCRFCLMAAAGGIAFSYSRGSYTGLLAVALVFGIANIKDIFLIVLTIISGLLLVPQSVMDRLFSVTHPDSSISERIRIWISSTALIKDNPLFGIGAGVNNTWALLLKNGINAPHMHSLAIQLLIEGGIIAFAIFIVIGWNIVHYGISISTSRNSSRFIGIVIIAFILGFIMCGAVDFPLMTPKLVGAFLAVLAFCDSAAVIFLDRRTSSLNDVLALKWKTKSVQGENVLCSHTKIYK